MLAGEGCDGHPGLVSHWSHLNVKTAEAEELTSAEQAALPPPLHRPPIWQTKRAARTCKCPSRGAATGAGAARPVWAPRSMAAVMMVAMENCILIVW